MANRWARWFVPDLALLVSAVTLFYVLALFDGGRMLFRDSDTGWHIRTGESILRGSGLPRSDPYSFSRPGKPWFAWEWGADVAMGAVHRWDGLRGVAWLYSLAVASSAWLWFRLHWASGGDFVLGCLMAPLMLTTASLHWLARPHVFGWVLLVLSLWLVERRAANRFTVVWAAALGALWANVHASFLLLPVMLGVFAAARRSRWLAAAGIGALAGSLANPYGWNLHRHVFAYLRDGELLAQIGEFQSFNFHLAGAWQIALALMVTIAGGALALARRDWARGLWMLAVGAMALRSARYLPLAALAALPFASGVLRGAIGWRGFLDYSAALRRHDARFAGYAWMPVLALLAFGYLHLPAVAARIGFPPERFPVAASSAVAGLPAGARLLAPDLYGGYLIYRFAGQRKVYSDGRSDFYGAAFLKDYVRLMQVRPGFEQALDGLGITHALLPKDYSLVAVLPRLGWKTIHRDQTAVLLERPH